MSEAEVESYELARDEFDAEMRHHLHWVRVQFGAAKERERAAQLAAALTCLANHNGVVCASG
jgi:hypothetical protein